MKKNRIYLSPPHIGDLEEKFVKEAFETNWIAPLGANVNYFEMEVADYVGVKGAAAMVSGTAAIHIALKCIGIKDGDKVLCSSLTFAASCNPIIYERGIPVFIDADPSSYNISTKALKKALEECRREGEVPKALIGVNLYGQSADWDNIREICNEYEVMIIEDSAESLGATYKGRMCGTLGDYGIYSFNGNKIITTSGGGMIVSNNMEMIEKSKFWISQSKENERYYEHKELGYNYKMSNVLVGIGRGQLRVIEERIRNKKKIYEYYKEKFSDISDIEMAPICEYGNSNYWLSIISLKKDSDLKPIDIILALDKEEIESRPIWKPMNLQPFYKKFKFFNHNDEGISVGEDIFNRGVCLPSDTKMTENDLDRVVKTIKKLFK